MERRRVRFGKELDAKETEMILFPPTISFKEAAATSVLLPTVVGTGAHILNLLTGTSLPVAMLAIVFLIAYFPGLIIKPERGNVGHALLILSTALVGGFPMLSQKINMPVLAVATLVALTLAIRWYVKNYAQPISACVFTLLAPTVLWIAMMGYVEGHYILMMTIPAFLFFLQRTPVAFFLKREPETTPTS